VTQFGATFATLAAHSDSSTSQQNPDKPERNLHIKQFNEEGNL